MPESIRDGVDKLVQYVYEQQGRVLRPCVQGVIGYHDTMPGRCWVNIHEGWGPWSMQFSVASDTRRVKLKPNDYVDLDTEEFDKLLEEAVELTEHHQQHSFEDLDDQFEEECTLADIHEHIDRYKEDDQGGVPSSEDDEYAGSHHSDDSGDKSDDASWLVNDSAEQADPDYQPGEVEGGDGDGADEPETDAESVDSQTHSGSTEEDHSLYPERAVAVDRHLPQAPVTPAQPLRVRQATQPEASSRPAARVHVRPELECIPGRKRLKRQLPADSEVKIEHSIDLTQPEEPFLLSPPVMTQPYNQVPSQQQQLSTTCDCGLPAAFCSASDCTALYCRPCDRKRKEVDPFKGFHFCSSACCNKLKYCEQHRSMLQMCRLCDELCCDRTRCKRCNSTICPDCSDQHKRAGCAAL